MEFKNYCLVVMGYTDGIVPEIEKISDSKPTILDAKGLILSTFTTFVDIQEIKAWFTMNKRSFLVFELNDETSAYFINKPDIQEGLFGFLANFSDESLKEKTSDFLKAIKNEEKLEDAVEIKNVKKIKPKEVSVADFEGYNKEEKNNLLNQYIDKGVENLTENERKILNFLAK